MTVNTAQTVSVRNRETSITRSDAFIVILLIITVIVLSVTVFSTESLRLDEAQSLWQTSHSLSTMMQIVGEDVHVPLYHVMLHFWQKFLGNSVSTARLLSLIFYVVTIPAMYLLGRFVYNRQTGLFSAVLLSISPFLNWYGNEIRMYSLFMLLTVFNMYFFMAIFMKREVIEEGRGGYIWAGYALTALFGIYTHYFFVFNLISQIFFYLAFRKYFPKRSFKTLAMIAIVLCICYAPWIYYVTSLGGASNTQPLLAKPTTIDVFNTFSQFLFGFQDDHINTILVSLWPILVLLIFLSLRQHHRVSPPTAYLFFSLILPIVMAFAISTTLKPIYLTRYLILTLPSLYLLISWILYVYPPRLSQALRIIIVVGMASMLFVEIVNANTPVKENYRQASDYLTQYAAAQDIIVASAPFTIYPLEYYYNGPVEIETLPLWNRLQYGSIPAFDETKLPAEVDQLKDNHEILWLLLSYDQGYEEKIRLYFDTHFERLVTVNFSPDLNLYAYRLRYDNKYRATFPVPATTTPAFNIRNLNVDWQGSVENIRKELRGL